jgi:hypothetical protein
MEALPSSTTPVIAADLSFKCCQPDTSVLNSAAIASVALLRYAGLFDMQRRPMAVTCVQAPGQHTNHWTFAWVQTWVGLTPLVSAVFDNKAAVSRSSGTCPIRAVNRPCLTSQ